MRGDLNDSSRLVPGQFKFRVGPFMFEGCEYWSVEYGFMGTVIARDKDRDKAVSQMEQFIVEANEALKRLRG